MYKLDQEKIIRDNDHYRNHHKYNFSKEFERFIKLSGTIMDDSLKESLKKISFNNWQHTDGELLHYMRHMFLDLQINIFLKIDITIIELWLKEVYIHYNNVPFHNFKHCFAVTQMMYVFVNMLNLQYHLDIRSIVILIISAICHDLDHPGLNNNYHINAKTELALRYNDFSPLENHHSSIAFHILSDPKFNLFQKLTKEDYKFIRAGIIKCILSTDMSQHEEILNKFRSIAPLFDFSNSEHKALLLMILIKSADVSNELRPLDVSTPWLELLFEEYFTQSDLEKSRNLPVTPYMDKDKICIPTSQVNFITYVLMPLFEALTSVFVHSKPLILHPVQEALKHYKNTVSKHKNQDLQKPNSGENLSSINNLVKNQLQQKPS